MNHHGEITEQPYVIVVAQRDARTVKATVYLVDDRSASASSISFTNERLLKLGIDAFEKSQSMMNVRSCVPLMFSIRKSTASFAPHRFLGRKLDALFSAARKVDAMR